MKSILYCFVSYQEKILEDSIIISKMMNQLNYDNYIIVYGGKTNKNIQSSKVIYLDCEDCYCGLPNKVNTIFKYVNNLNYDFFVKLDRTTKVKKILPKLLSHKYMGYIWKYSSSGTNHFNRCENKNHPWNTKQFYGSPIFYCSGAAYVLSKESVDIIAQDNEEYKNHIYEDYYIGYLLNKFNINPEWLTIRNFFDDQDHPKIFAK